MKTIQTLNVKSSKETCNLFLYADKLVITVVNKPTPKPNSSESTVVKIYLF